VSLITGCMTALAYVFILLGGGLAVLLCLSGTAALGHLYPVLIVCLAAVLFGTLLLWFVKSIKQI